MREKIEGLRGGGESEKNSVAGGSEDQDNLKRRLERQLPEEVGEEGR